MDIIQLLSYAVSQQATDLHLCVNKKPVLRIGGKIVSSRFSQLTMDDLKQINTQLNEPSIQGLALNLEQDFAISIPKLGRFRIHCFLQQSGLSLAIRILPEQIPSVDQLNLPHRFLGLCQQSQGLILITGPTGSGKSTSLASLINHINLHQAKHIICIEDPVEYVFTDQQSLISQREVGSHTCSFEQGLIAALREDPDIIVIGELRDLSTIRLALSAAETGHLVVATLHTSSAHRSIHRIVEVFQSTEKDFIRNQLADCLIGILAQQLVANSPGQSAAKFELLIANPAIRNLIRENKIPQIYSMMQMSGSMGMSTFS